MGVANTGNTVVARAATCYTICLTWSRIELTLISLPVLVTNTVAVEIPISVRSALFAVLTVWTIATICI